VVYANSKYYLATKGQGVLVYNPGAAPEDKVTTLPDTAGKNIVGIIKLNATYLVAAEYGGTIYQIDASNVVEVPTGNMLSGALATWCGAGKTTPELLLAGVSGGSYNYGYLEINIKTTDGTLDAGTIHTPGAVATGGITTMPDNSAQYAASIKKQPVNSLMQGPNDKDGTVIFASTQQNGLWSLRGNEWNAEE
jgi:hypothetical protein